MSCILSLLKNVTEATISDNLCILIMPCSLTVKISSDFNIFWSSSAQTGLLLGTWWDWHYNKWISTNTHFHIKGEMTHHKTFSVRFQKPVFNWWLAPDSTSFYVFLPRSVNTEAQCWITRQLEGNLEFESHAERLYWPLCCTDIVLI